MISLKNINKYYFKGENREIHVVNNVTLEFPDAGFVTILGASGSGKTTLLNIIGGLDKYDSGTITYNDKEFNGYNMDDVDRYRSEKMGYIFQNYLLINNISVYNNLKVALEAMGVTHPAEQKKRIEYALRCVGLFKYRKKKVKNLSGGQMQRVSIARCLVKDADIIIADEPTGNIDSENTIQIMNILKHISKTKLVILVTHEIPMARYYSDRIIQVKDGKIISDGIVTNNGSLNTQTDRKIYLGDLDKKESSSKKLNFELFVDEESTTSDVVIVVRNDTIYVKSDKKIVNLNESSIELVNESYHDVEDSLANFDFDTSWYKSPTEPTKKNFFFTNFFNGFKEFASQGKIKVLFIVINIILGILLGTVFINLGNFVTIDYSTIIDETNTFVVIDKNTEYGSEYPINESNVYEDALKDNVIKDIYPVRTYNEYIIFQENYVFYETHQVSFWGLPYNNDIKLLLGNRPYSFECVIGKKFADELITLYQFQEEDYEKLLGKELPLYPDTLKIVGIAESDSKAVYVNNTLFSSSLLYKSNRFNQYVFGCSLYYNDSITLTSGHLPTNDNELAVEESIAVNKNLKIGDTLSIDYVSYKITGLFKEIGVQDVPGFLLATNKYAGYSYDFDLSITKEEQLNFTKLYLPSYEYEITEGREILAPGECLVNVNSGLNIGDYIHKSKIVGYYKKSSVDGSFDQTLMYDHLVIVGCGDFYNNNLSAHSFTLDESGIKYFEDKGFEVLTLRDYQIKAQQKYNLSNNIGMLIFAVILFIASVLLTYLSNRGKIINEIGTLGVYRSIGKSRKTLIYQKMGYNFIMTTVSTLIGYSLSWTIHYISKSFLAPIMYQADISPLILIFGLIILYAIGVFVGILPILSLVKKTPAEINSKYDI